MGCKKGLLMFGRNPWILCPANPWDTLHYVFCGHFHLGTRYVLLICLREKFVPNFRLVRGSRSTLSKLPTYHGGRRSFDGEKEIHSSRLYRGRGSNSSVSGMNLERGRLPSQHNFGSRHTVHCSLLVTTVRKNWDSPQAVDRFLFGDRWSDREC